MSEAWIPATLLLTELAVRGALILRVLWRGGRHPSATLAWCLVLLAFPILGIVLYVLVGEVRLGASRRRRHDDIAAAMRSIAVTRQVDAYLAELPADYSQIMVVAENAGAMPVRRGHEVEIRGDTEQILGGIVADIDAARDHCHLLFYIWLADEAGQQVAAALERAATRGVTCRLLLDAAGSKVMLRSPLTARLRRAGVEVLAALPANPLRVAFSRVDLRNHRKIVVIDGVLGWTGSQNVANASFAPKARFAPWVDCMLRIRGPAVRDLQELFLTDWFLDSDDTHADLLQIDPPIVPNGVPIQILPSGPGYDPDAVRRIVQAACQRASEELILTTPYFVPGEAEVAAICTAASRGVRTLLVLPQRNDSRLVGAASRSHYEELFAAGVEIHEYTKGLLHAKTLTVDRNCAMVGTANFDRRSFELNYEVTVLLYDTDVASRLRFLQRSYMADSVPVDPQQWARRSWRVRLGSNVAGLLSPIL